MTPLVRNLVLALSVSVLLNVFVIGIWAGRFMRPHPRREPESIAADADRSSPLRGVWNQHDGVLRPKREAVDSARRAVREALVAEPFDAALLESALAQLRTDSDAAQLALHRALVEAARGLGVEDRRRLASSRWLLQGGFRRDPARR